MNAAKSPKNPLYVLLTWALVSIPVIGIYILMLRWIDVAFKSFATGRLLGIYATLLVVWLIGAWLAFGIGYIGMFKISMQLVSISKPLARSAWQLPYLGYLLACLIVAVVHSRINVGIRDHRI